MINFSTTLVVTPKTVEMTDSDDPVIFGIEPEIKINDGSINKQLSFMVYDQSSENGTWVLWDNMTGTWARRDTGSWENWTEENIPLDRYTKGNYLLMLVIHDGGNSSDLD